MPARARLFDFTTGLFRHVAPIKLRPDAAPPPAPAPPPPSTAARFGPTGLYWPPNTPLYDGSDAALSIEVACTGSAIQTALAGLTSAQVSAGVRILVQPGEMPSGTSESSPAVSFVGDPAWTKRVLVRPRDTRDSVVWRGHFRGVNSVIWAGFQSAGFRIYGGINTGWARILDRGAGYHSVFSRADQPAMTGLYLGEFVRRETRVTNSDSMAIWTYTNDIQGAVCEGWHVSPNYRADSSGHTDTLQMEPFNSGFVRNITFRGCAMFASNNTAVQVNGVRSALFEKSYLVRYDSQSRYPTPAGYDPALIASSTPVNGKTDALLSFTDSVVMGKLSISNPNAIGTVTNTVLSHATTLTPVSGSFTVDSSLNDSTHPDSPPAPTDTYLNSIWGL